MPARSMAALGLRTQRAIRIYQDAARQQGYLEAIKGPQPAEPERRARRASRSWSGWRTRPRPPVRAADEQRPIRRTAAVKRAVPPATGSAAADPGRVGAARPCDRRHATPGGRPAAGLVQPARIEPAGSRGAAARGDRARAAGRAVHRHAEELDWSPPQRAARVLDAGAAGAGGRAERPPRRHPRASRSPAPTRALLAELVADRALRLGTSPSPLDRYGDLVAQVERTDGLWLQGALLERGLAQVRTRPDEVARAAAMLGLEQAARAAGRGLWREPALAPRPADQLADAVGSFQIVRGRVLRVAPTEHYVYLNFGGLAERLHPAPAARGTRRELRPFSGRRAGLSRAARIEVRGFVLDAGGPLIELSHPEQIQVLP